MQQLLTNVTEYGIKDIAKILPIGEQQIRRYIGTGELKAIYCKTATLFLVGVCEKKQPAKQENLALLME